MATYLGADNSGVAGTMYRRQPFTYIGQTKMSSPFKLNYDTTIASAAQSTAPNVGTYTLPQNEQSIPTSGQQMDLGTAFPGFKDQWVPGAGNVSFPVSGTPGQVYEDSNGNRWYLTGYKGDFPEWKKIVQNKETGAWEFEDKSQTMQPFTYEQQSQIDTLNAQIKAINRQLQFKPSTGAQYSGGREWVNPIWAQLEGQKAELQKQLNAITQTSRTIGEAEIFSPVTQMKNVMKGIGAGDIKITNDDGVLDTTDLRAQGGYGNWMADMLENSYKTGALQTDFYQTDAQGNVVKDDNNKPVYVPELQTMINYITNGTPEDQQKWNQYRRDVAGYALAQGQTVNSGYYQDALASDIANRAAQASTQISTMMTKEIESQYEYITNSLGNALVEMGYLTTKEGFAQEMATNYAKINEAYREGIEELAQQVAEAHAARRGDVFAGILGGLTNVVLGIISHGLI